MMKYPERKGEIDSRLALPLTLPPSKEAKYFADMQEPGCESRIRDLVLNKNFNEFLSKCNKIVWRNREASLLQYANIVDSMFPICSRNYDKGRWASYRNKKVIISKGNDKGGKERGVPFNVCAEVSYNVISIHDFFCVREALFQRTEEKERIDMERCLAWLRI